MSSGSLEDKIDCSWTSLDGLDEFLSNVLMLTLSLCKKIRHSVHLIKYLEAFMPNDGHNAQSNMVQTILAI